MQVNREICVGCGACVNLCPRLAIRFIDSRSYIDQQSCIECGTCRDACGVDAIYADCRFPDIIMLNATAPSFLEAQLAVCQKR
ncbi:MAG: 4Fe-4S binding protein [Desulfobacterota bacterium]|nr:4Fe-4S binding protein [Thermodesulfobacteriota bacterium]